MRQAPRSWHPRGRETDQGGGRWVVPVLQVPQSVNLWYQSALLTTELEAIFANARPAPQSHLDERVKKVYRVATGLEAPQPPGTSSDAVELIKKRIPQQDDSCPICCQCPPLLIFSLLPTPFQEIQTLRARSSKAIETKVGFPPRRRRFRSRLGTRPRLLSLAPRMRQPPPRRVLSELGAHVYPCVSRRRYLFSPPYLSSCPDFWFGSFRVRFDSWRV